ncbi:hypothetical protein Zm00014a_017152 [Zea mays]|jgi:hypothetical protein|uniref:Uncharacterized protein n=1 Tax=Zea mays TaxID=4577 RepID=A0A317YC39_MAIZE|nr:hypothetical protein Zm00014a_017152 [Zea mays]
MLGQRSSSGPPPKRSRRVGRPQRKQEEELSLWRKKLVLQSIRVDVFMGYSENPMNPPQGKETRGFLRRGGDRADRQGLRCKYKF